jgi:RNA polymerase sigma-70 factor, ECF subfamily
MALPSPNFPELSPPLTTTPHIWARRAVHCSNVLPDLVQPSDGDLLTRAANGDEDAFTALYRRRSTAVYRFALGMTGSREAAEEVVQETFMALIERPGGFDPRRGELASYLYGIARNQGLRQFRDLAQISVPETEAAEPPEILDALQAQERIEAVRRAVLALPETYREAVLLCDLEELSYAAAAEALGTAVGTVRSRLHRGRALLAKKLAWSAAGKEAR